MKKMTIVELEKKYGLRIVTSPSNTSITGREFFLLREEPGEFKDEESDNKFVVLAGGFPAQSQIVQVTNFLADRIGFMEIQPSENMTIRNIAYEACARIKSDDNRA